MSTTDLISYWRLAQLNRRMFVESLKIDLALILLGLFYVYTGMQLQLSPSSGLLLLLGMLLTAQMSAQLLKNNSAGLSFYYKLPLSRRTMLAGLYIFLTLPSLLIFIALSGCIYSASFFSGLHPHFPELTRRGLQVIFMLLFFKTLTVNSMMAKKLHFAAIFGYFLIMSGIAVILMILKEILSYFIAIPNPIYVLIFLLLTFIISFIALSWIEP
ncbi:hypothetical protein JW877_05165 [bacterium]|nr:hypothetical protein [bacterium]